MDKKKMNPSLLKFSFGARPQAPDRKISKRAGQYYTRNSAEHKRRSLNRTLMMENLEDREVLSAISPIAANVPETASLMDSAAVYAPATIVPETTGTVEMIQVNATPSNGENVAHPTLQQAQSTDALFASEETLNATLFQSQSLIGLPSMPGAGGIPANYRPSIPGIPGTDTGGVAGDNGGGRLALEIPGFRGYGNAYYLDINDETLPRTVWLYAQYFRNQPRVTPGQTWLVRPDIDYSWANYHFDGVRISTSVYSMITDEALEEQKQEKIEDIMQQEEREEKIPTFLEKENQMEKQIPKTLQDVPETNEIPKTPSAHDTTTPPQTLETTENQEKPSTETDAAKPSPLEVPKPQERPAYPVPQPQTPATPPIMDPSTPKPMRSGEESELK